MCSATLDWHGRSRGRYRCCRHGCCVTHPPPETRSSLHINLRAETAGFSRAEEARGGAGSLSTLDLRAAVSGFLLLKTPNCGTLVLVGDCPDRAEGTIRALHPWTRFERVTN